MVSAGAESSAPRARRWALALLLVSLVLAVSAPLILNFRRSFVTGFAANAMMAMLQATPYLLCAALWLPWRRAFADRAALWVAVLLGAGALYLYVPMLIRPGTYSGDMTGLLFLMIVAISVPAVLIVSLLLFLFRRQLS